MYRANGTIFQLLDIRVGNKRKRKSASAEGYCATQSQIAIDFPEQWTIKIIITEQDREQIKCKRCYTYVQH